MNEIRKTNYYVYKIMAILISIYFLILFISLLNPEYKSLIIGFWVEDGVLPKRSMILPFLLYIYAFLFSFFLYNRLIKINTQTLIICILFLVAITPRLIIVYSADLHSDATWGGGDFVNYINYSKWFINGDYASIANSAESYKLPTFAGLAVLNGVIGMLFSPSAFGLQIANCIMTSLSSVVIYGIGANYKRNVGIIASIIFAFYPANIVMTAIPTNQHGGVLMTLVGLYFLSKLMESKNPKKIILFVIIVVISFVISNCFHPSVIVSILAIVCFVLFSITAFKNNKKIVVSLICVVITYFMLVNICNYTFLKFGLLNSTNQMKMTANVVIGLNHDTIGQWDKTDVDMLFNKEDVDVDKYIQDSILKRISDPQKMLNLFIKKGIIMWLKGEDSFWRYTDATKYNPYNYDGNNQEYDPQYSEKYRKISNFYNSLSIIDTCYIIAVIFTSFIGLILRRRDNLFNIFDVLQWTILGHIGWRMFAEVCPRYRYFGIVILIFFASIGISIIIEWLQANKSARIRKLINKIP